jgi:hypothetical protein
MSEITPQKDEPLTVCLADLPPASPESLRAHESAYRRGFCQGYAQALADRQGSSPQQCDEHLYDELLPWRYERHHGAMTFPPTLGEAMTRRGPDVDEDGDGGVL